MFKNINLIKKYSLIFSFILLIIIPLCSCSLRQNISAKLPDDPRIKAAYEYIYQKYNKSFNYVSMNAFLLNPEDATKEAAVTDESTDSDKEDSTAYSIRFKDENDIDFMVIYSEREEKVLGDTYADKYYSRKIADILNESLGDNAVSEVVLDEDQTYTGNLNTHDSCKNIDEYSAQVKKVEFRVYRPKNALLSTDNADIKNKIKGISENLNYSGYIFTFSEGKYTEIREVVLAHESHGEYGSETEGFISKSSLVNEAINNIVTGLHITDTPSQGG